MSQSSPRVPLPGSERKPLAEVLPGARDIGPITPGEQVEVSIYLKQPESLASLPPGQRLTREEYAAQAQASTTALEQVNQFAHQYGLTVLEADPVRRLVRLQGTAEAMHKAFGG